MTIYQGKELTKQSFYDMNDYLRKKRIAEVIPHFTTDVVLDVGCGAGESTAELMSYSATAIGIDTDPSKIMTAIEAYPHYSFQCAEVRDMPEKFATIHCGHVIEHVKNPVRFLGDCRSKLPDYGRIIVTTPNAKSLHKRIGDLMGLSRPYELSCTDNEQGHKHVFDMLLLEAFLRTAQFDVIYKQGLMLKPFPSSMMWDLFDVKILDGFWEIGRDPDLIDYCSSIMIVGEKRP